MIAIRLCAIAAGAAIVGSLGRWCVGLAGHWFEFHVARSEDDLSRAFVAMLVVFAASIIAGGWLGDSLYRRWRPALR